MSDTASTLPGAPVPAERKPAGTQGRVPGRERLLVIGAGPVGLAFAKALKTHGVPYDQVDAAQGVGGNWRHGVYRTAHIISSRRTTEYPDFPMPEAYPDFPSADQMLAYLEAYADAFGLHQHLRLGTEVRSVRPRPDALWDVTFAGGEGAVYKGVLVCNGHHWSRHVPRYPGSFSGRTIHSKDYQGPEELRGRRVLVVGGGNSACDIASEAARVAATCALSLRRGYWFLPKTILGRPLPELIPPWLPVATQRLLLRAALALVVGDYRRYGLPKPDHRIFDHHPTINSELLHYIRHGRIRPRPRIDRLAGEEVLFGDGTRECFDLIVYATGYDLSFPFLPEGMVPVEGKAAQLYGGCLLPEHKHLYVLGTGQPRYGFGPLVTPAAELLVDMIRLQDEMELPLGRVLAALGQKPPRTHLIDPHAALRQMRRARKRLRVLLPIERRLRRRISWSPVTAAAPWGAGEPALVRGRSTPETGDLPRASRA